MGELYYRVYLTQNKCSVIVKLNINRVEGFVMRKRAFTCIDLFSGAGGLSEGFRQTGFNVVVANDFDQHSVNTYKLNHPETVVLDGPIENITVEKLLDIPNLGVGKLDCLIGGPPCQAFSVYNHQRGMHDQRSGLFREYLRIVEGIRPKIVVMENVTGITSIEKGLAVNEIMNRLTELGYNVENRILKAEEYGVPQERRRIFFIGSRLGENILWPEPTHGEGLAPYVTIWDAFSDLPLLENGRGEEQQSYITFPLSEYQRYLRKGSGQIYNHIAPRLSQINLERLQHIPQGGSWRDIPNHLLPPGMRRARRSDHTKRYGRLHPNGLACTVLTKCDPHWGAFFHPDQVRAITVREAARLQSFPDRVCFTGPRAEQYRQVGNAVPPLLAAAVAKVVRNMLGQADESLEVAL